MIGIEETERFRDPRAKIAAVGLEWLHPPDIDIPQIHWRVATIHPFGQHHAGTAGGLDPHRVKAGGDEEILQFRRLAKDIAVIRGKAFRPVEECLDTGRRQHRQTFHGAFEDGFEMIEILGQRVEFKILGNAVHAPWLGIRLKSAKQDLASILLVVGAFIGHPQHRQVRGQPGDPLGHDVEMLAGMKRHGDAGLLANPTRPHAAGIDHIIGLDRPLVGHYASHPAVGFVDIGDLDTLDDLHAIATRALGKRLGDVHRVGLPVLCQPDPADSIIDLQPRIAAGDIRRGDLVNFDAKGPRHRRRTTKLFHPFIGQRHGHRPVTLEACRNAGLRLKPEIQLLRIFRQPRHVLCRAKLRDQPGRVPGGATGQLLALEKNNIGPAKLAKMVGNRTADHPAPDDDSACLCRNIHGTTPSSVNCRDHREHRPRQARRGARAPEHQR